MRKKIPTARTGSMADTICERLAETRAEAGYSRRALGVAAGLSPRIVALVESGKTAPKRSTLERLAEVLGCHAEWLATGRGPRRRRRVSS